MVWPLIIGAGAALLGGKMQSDAAKSAAGTSAAATDRTAEIQREINDRNIALQREMFNRNIELQEPFRQSGLNALNKLTPLATEYTPFGMQQFQQDPGYAFRMSEGMKGLERSAAARGGLLSGATLKGIQQYGQDMASQEYQNAFNRYGIERDRRLGPLQSLAGVGQTTSQQLGAAGTQFANTVGQGNTQFANTMGNLNMNQANVMGNAQMARASAYGNTLNQLANIGGRYLGGSGGGTASGIGSNTYSGQGPYGYAP
jgi:hypothetical protein